jgi:F-type H+-transporting ATPase subunit b
MENINTLTGIILPYLNFALFVAMCVYFFRKPLREMATKRRADFESMLRDATKAKQEALEKNRELTERLRKLDAEVAAIKDSAIQGAQRDADRLTRDAEVFAKNLLEEARRMADAEVERARAALKSEIIASVRDAVESKIRSDLKPADHVALIKQNLGSLDEMNAR